MSVSLQLSLCSSLVPPPSMRKIGQKAPYSDRRVNNSLFSLVYQFLVLSPVATQYDCPVGDAGDRKIESGGDLPLQRREIALDVPGPAGDGVALLTGGCASGGTSTWLPGPGRSVRHLMEHHSGLCLKRMRIDIQNTSLPGSRIGGSNMDRIGMRLGLGVLSPDPRAAVAPQQRFH